MNLKQIKVGSVYQTDLGIGDCVSVGGRFPPSVQINVRFPFPRGKCNLTPRQVQYELAPCPECSGSGKGKGKGVSVCNGCEGSGLKGGNR